MNDTVSQGQGSGLLRSRSSLYRRYLPLPSPLVGPSSRRNRSSLYRQRWSNQRTGLARTTTQARAAITSWSVPVSHMRSPYSYIRFRLQFLQYYDPFTGSTHPRSYSYPSSDPPHSQPGCPPWLAFSSPPRPAPTCLAPLLPPFVRGTARHSHTLLRRIPGTRQTGPARPGGRGERHGAGRTSGYGTGEGGQRGGLELSGGLPRE